jgi:hypothetical protein
MTAFDPSKLVPGFLKDKTPESWNCIDCGIDTAPGCLPREELEQAHIATWAATGDVKASVEQSLDGRAEVYTVRERIWKKAGMAKVYAGCLCVGCLEARLGRRLRPRDFHPDDPFTRLPSTDRLLDRRWRTA